MQPATMCRAALAILDSMIEVQNSQTASVLF